MGTINKGILGVFKGTVGTVVGSSWRGISYIKSRPGKRSGQPSQLQAEQQAKFSLMIKFMLTLRVLLETTFSRFANGMTGMNSAFSYNLKNAVTGTYPDFSIDFASVLISRGDLPNAGLPAATAGTAGKIDFTWTDNSGTGKAAATDTCILVAYCADKNLSVYKDAGAARSAGSDTLDVPAFSGKTVQTWVAFMSAGGSEISVSEFTGAVDVL